MASYSVVHEKPEAFYDTFERKGELQGQTHYCPGCGHGIVSKLLAVALVHHHLVVQPILIKLDANPAGPAQPLPGADERRGGAFERLVDFFVAGTIITGDGAYGIVFCRRVFHRA